MTAAIAAGDRHTAEAGARLLAAGGSAVDAICAASCMAFVAEAPLCGPGGGGVLLAGEGSDAAVLDFFSTVPGRGVDPAAPLDFFGVDVDFGPTTQRFHIGRGSVAVPGTLLGLLRAHERWGSLPLTEIVAPAVEAARAGIVPSDQLGFIVALLRPILEHSPPTRALFFDPMGAPRFANPALADVLEAVAREGERFVRGELHSSLLREFGPSSGGRLTAADLDDYAPARREPLRTEFCGATVLTNPPPSAGGSLVARGLELARRHPGPPWLAPSHIAELSLLLAGIDHAKAGASPEQTEAFFDAEQVRRNLGSTTHISVLDHKQRFASLTMSNGEGCGYTVASTGLHLNNFLGEHDINPGGFHRQAPGTRMTTMMAPTVALRGGRPMLVLGTGGSNRIRSALLSTLLHTLRSGRPLVEAIVAPRMHVEGQTLWYERTGMSPEAERALERAWPDAIAFDTPNMFFGGVHAIATEPHVHGVGDARRGGVAIEV